MNREEAKLILPFVTALAEGRQIQALDVNEGDWEDIDEITVDYFLSHHLDYRIKPEPTYRPFKNAEECWNEMQKHQPFGWIKSKDDSTINKFMFIDSLENNAANICTSSDFSYNKLTECYIFADGTPFGMEEVL
jgi:hypothetical protein